METKLNFSEQNKCPKCVWSYSDMISLSKHWARTHKLETKELYLKLHELEQEPTCKCGCKGQVKFLDAGRGFSEYILGHAARISNNWGNNPKAMENSQATRRQMIKDGTWKPFHLRETGEHWSLGLTAETDERVSRMTDSINTNPEELKARSDRMREGRLDGTVPSLYGPEHSQWKGGISSLYGTCHANTRFYKEWKYPKLVQAGFKCEQCSFTKDLQVHHNKMRMAEIVHLIAKQEGWNDWFALQPEIDEETFKLKLKIADLVATYHIQNNIEAIVLCEDCHKQEHKSLNF